MQAVKGLTAFVTGATGEVGRGVAYALSEAGAFVYLSGRSLDKLQAIQSSLPNKAESEIIAADYSTVEGAKELDDKLRDLDRKLDLVVASSGPWWPINKIAEQGDIDTLYKAVQSSLLAQLFLYKVLAPHCKPANEGGQYLMVNGAAGLNIVGTGLTGVLAHSCIGAAKLMNDECSGNSGKWPNYTHVLLSSSVGHAQFRGDTHDPNEYGKAFVAMALKKHAEFKDGSGTLLLDDAMFETLVAALK
jgi:NAD(P)-dependent dehydrogenase (short-subunit alcohol dehydrogenase family)